MTTTNAVRGASGVDAPAGDEPSAGPAPDGSLLPEPGQVGLSADSMTALAQLLTRADLQDRTNARQREDEADDAAMKYESQRVAQMYDKADQDSAQAVATGVGEVVGGTLVAGSGFLPDGGSSGGDDDDDAGGTSWRLVAEGAGKVAPGIGTIVAGGHKAEADRDDGRAAMFEAQAQMAIRRHDGERDEAQAASDSLSKVRDLLQSMQQTTNDSRSSAASELRG